MLGEAHEAMDSILFILYCIVCDGACLRPWKVPWVLRLGRVWHVLGCTHCIWLHKHNILSLLIQ
jgi:hypothetical protein